ncbi:MAG: hypothetical protein ACREV5_17410 [Steroidobacter sp.]
MNQKHEPVEDLLSDPTRRYAKPLDVVNDQALSLDEKRRILESWKQDAEQLSTAQAENMGGGERPLLQEVSLALGELERIGGRRH